jgi:hypothetical protein
MKAAAQRLAAMMRYAEIPIILRKRCARILCFITPPTHRLRPSSSSSRK